VHGGGAHFSERLIGVWVSHWSRAQGVVRPYRASGARSCQQATIEIVEEQFVAVDTAVDGATLTTTNGISAGITQAMTPTVMADDRIRINLALEDSQFIPVTGDALVAKDRNTALSSVTVASGQTIVIGGLKSKLLDSTNSGLPWLRRIPLLDLVTAEQGSREANKEVQLCLTPHVWVPGMDVPLIRPDIPQDRSRGLFTPYECREGGPGV
jgi:Flp pilus assembly secretin CpaC